MPRTLVDNTLDSCQESPPRTPPHSSPNPILQKTVSSVIVPNSKAQPRVTPDHLVLVEEIERVTGDTWSRGNFINLVRQCDEQMVYAALSVTREKLSLESGVNLGAYFTATLKGMIGLATLGARPVADPMTQQSRPSHVSMDTPARRPTPRFFHLDAPEPKPVDPGSLTKGWKIQYKSAGVQGMLTLVQRCAPVSVDVRSLWVDVRAALPGMEESFAVDRFLDTVVTRMKHAERMVEAR